MIKKLREVFLAKDKKAVIYLALLAALGVLLLVLSDKLLIKPAEPPLPDAYGLTAAEIPEETAQAAGGGFFIRERELEKRLEEAFAIMEDVGRVEVLVSLSPDKETVYAKDIEQTDSVTKETDSQGGSRETRDQSRREDTIMFTDGAGTDRPLVLREIDQKIEGAVIIAEGGDSVFVKDALTKAACTILGVEANKVQVLKMKN